MWVLKSVVCYMNSWRGKMGKKKKSSCIEKYHETQFNARKKRKIIFPNVLAYEKILYWFAKKKQIANVVAHFSENLNGQILFKKDALLSSRSWKENKSTYSPRPTSHLKNPKSLRNSKKHVLLRPKWLLLFFNQTKHNLHPLNPISNFNIRLPQYNWFKFHFLSTINPTQLSIILSLHPARGLAREKSAFRRKTKHHFRKIEKFSWPAFREI